MAGLVNSFTQVVGATNPDNWNPLDKDTNLILSNGNLSAERGVAAQSFSSVRSTQSKTTGKWHFEVYGDVLPSTSEPYDYFGIANSGLSLTTNPRTVADTISYRIDGIVWANGSDVLNASTKDMNTGELIAIEVDVDNKTFHVNVNGAWNGPYSWSYMSGPIFAFACLSVPSDKATVNFGATPFSITPQSGYSAWNV